MVYFQNTSPRIISFYGESTEDLALMPTTTKIGEGEYPHALAPEGSYAFILENDGLSIYRLRSTGWIDATRRANSGGSGAGTEDYRDLTHKPTINNVELRGNKTSKDLKLLTKDQVFHYGASINFANLPGFSEETLNGVYTIRDSFTTNANFINGAGIIYRPGAIVVLVNLGTDENPNYKYSILSGTIAYDTELSNSSENTLQTKVIKRLLDEKSDKFQYSSLPTASAEYAGRTLQYVGPTDDNAGLVHNYFYECLEDDTTSPSTYSWENVRTSPGGGGSIDINDLTPQQIEELADIINGRN